MDKDNRYTEFIQHFSGVVSDDLKDFARDQLLDFSRYLFVHSNSRMRLKRGYCTHCKNNYVLPDDKKFKHNEPTECEKCGSAVYVKQAGRGRGRMLDVGYLVWYEKSKVNPKAITATGYLVDFDYREDFKGVAKYKPVTRYLFEIGKTSMMHRKHSYSGCFSNRTIQYEDGWVFAKNPYSLIGKHSYTRNSMQSLENIKDIADGTLFMYSTWDKFIDNNQDAIHFFTKFSKYPFIEYLSKMGMGEIVQHMVYERNMYRSINYRGKTMEKILGLSKQEIKAWKTSGVEMEPLVLYTYKWFRRAGVPIAWDVAKQCDYLLVGTHYLDRLTKMQELLPLKTIMAYLLNQSKKRKSSYTKSVSGILSDWNDYLNECKELGMDIASTAVLMPNNLQKAHEKTTRAIKIKHDEKINQQIKKQQNQLQKLCYQAGDLMIRPAASSIELFDEGKALNHCVARYADRYAKGDIVILFIRHIDKPDTPYYTVELDGESKRVLQCRGKNNKGPVKKVDLFIKTFEQTRLKRKERKAAV